MKAGLCSITFRKLSVDEIVALTAQAGLAGIEWGGDVHVPHGDLAAARAARDRTRDAGLQVSSYGSYYRAGESEQEGLAFGRVLDSARELGAPCIRVWAGRKGSADAGSTYREGVISDLQRIGTEAAAANVRVALEWHGGSLTDRLDSTVRLMEEVQHSNVWLYWQPATGIDEAARLAGLTQVLLRVANVHVFHWRPTPGGQDRRPLVEGAAVWQKYLGFLEKDGADRWCLLEFVSGDLPTQFLEDARALRAWLERKPS